MFISALVICAVERLYKAVNSVESLALNPVTGDVHHEGAVEGQEQKTTIKAVVNLLRIRAATAALLEEDRLNAECQNILRLYQKGANSRQEKKRCDGS